MKPILEIDPIIINVLENFFNNIMIYNGNGQLLYACSKFWKDTGLTPEEFKGKGITEIKKLGIYDPYAAGQAYETKEKATVVQYTFMDEISVATALPIKNPDNEIFLIVAYAENNETIIELERKLEEANNFIAGRNKEISRFISNMLFDSKNIGNSTEVLKVHKLIEKIADFDANVLLVGETGVGKTMYAEKIHSSSIRKHLPFIEINCAAIPETLLESELFGYEKGAFTGASEKGKLGQIELAAGGTLFLDEISELSLNLQSKLLKVIQDKKILRIGGTTPIEVDFRLITASNKNLQELIEDGLFRRDLFYRLNVIPIDIPALRNRREDIHPLASFFLERFNSKYNAKKRFDKEVINCFTNYEWPGNVRELENLMERLVLTAEADEIQITDIPSNMIEKMLPFISLEQGLHQTLESIEKNILLKEFIKYNGNITKMSKKLGLTRQSTLRRLQKYGINKELSENG